MDGPPKARPRRLSKHQLLDDEGQAERGLVNPAVQMDSDKAYQTFSQTEGESSAAEIEEIGQAKSLVKDLKTRRRQRQKELSKLTTPKDDVTGELKTVKMKSKQKVEETTREEMADALAEAREAAEVKEETVAIPLETEDGTVPMPTEAEDGTVPMPEEITARTEGTIETTRTEEEPTIPVLPEETPKEEKPPESPPTSRGMSLRARMQSRLQKAKEQAETELREEAREERQRLKDKRQLTLTRFDTEMSETDIETLAEERRNKVKQRWLKMGMTVDMQESGMPTIKMAHDFFTRHWGSDEEEEPTKPEVKPGKKPEEKAEEEKPEGEKPEEEKPEGETPEGEETVPKAAEPAEGEQEEETTDDKQPLLGEKEEDELGFGLVVMKKPEFIDPAQQKELQEKLLFMPSSRPVPASEKIIGDVEPRFLEEEGFYVGVRPKIPARNQNKMEQRLIRQPDNKGLKWFGEDGRIIALPDPLRPSPSRPVVPDEPDPDLETVFRKAVMHEYDQRYIDGVMEGGGQYQLDVDINSLEFSHHHLFSKEHVLAGKLFDLYEQYYIRKKKNMTEFLREKLQALKASKIHLEEHITNNKSEMSASDRHNYEKRLKDYKYEIKQTRIMRDREEEVDRALLKCNIHTWKELKTQREEQAYTNTSLKLNITSEEANKVQDQVWWKNEIEEELYEIREEFEEEYKDKLVIYNEQVLAVEKQKEEKVEAKKKLKRVRRGSQGSKSSKASKASKVSNDLTEDERKALQEIVEAPDLLDPDPPEHFDENKMREELKKKALKIRRRPGEPILQLLLTNGAVVTPTNQCPRGEQQRRDDVSHTKLFVTVFFNNKEVCQTTLKPLSQDFTVNFGYIYNLKIVQWPESIKYEIHESRGVGSTLLTRLYAGIPEPSITAQNVLLDDFEFSAEHIVQFSHEAVGSGVPFSFKSAQSPIVILMTTGTLRSSVSWGVDDSGAPLTPPIANPAASNIFSAMKLNDPVAAIGTSGVMNLERLAKWFEQARLDPNDPANADLVYLLGSKGGESQLGPRDFFRLEQLLEEFNLATDEELAENKRFRLIQMRDLEVPEFQNFKFVPPFEKEIPRDAFMEYDKRKREKDMIKSDNIEIRHAAAKRSMQKVREKVMQYLRQEAHQKAFQDVVKEDTLPPFIDLISELLNMAEPKRPLKPVRKKLDPRPIIRGPHDPPPYILVNVIRAFDIPIRKSAFSEGGGGQTTRRDTIPNIFDNSLVRPFVEAIFQETIAATSVIEGPNPSFNEELQLVLEAPANDYSSKSLQKITDSVYLNLFDEVIHNVGEEDGDRKSSIHQRIERKWLGSLRIPFSTIYLNAKIDGIFRINKPPILLGYSTKDTADTYIQLFITTQPPLKIPEPVKYKFPSNEKDKLLERSDVWQGELEAKFPKRQYITTVVDMNCKTVFVTRYLKSLKPPDEIAAGGPELVAWYVSLIPFVSDAFIFPGMSDIWSTCDLFIQLLAGDEEEHAVLLANYFMSMGKNTWLVTGTAIPEGPTCYVLTKESEVEMTIWNAGTAESFSQRDSRCPLISVGCLINHENIWANVHVADKPSKLDFDLSKTTNWKPFFGKGFPSPGLSSIQPEALVYKPVDENAVLLLKETIEQALKNKIMDWRSRFITRWNRHCTQIMRKILPSLEESCGKFPNPQHLQELETSFSQYKVSGFPLHMPFNNLENIIETLRATGVHAQDTSDIEFALAVYVKAYPSSILSVWVYVASLIRIR